MEKKSKQDRGIATRDKIIEVGRNLINERGYDDVSVDEIMQRCGLAKGTFYRHFSSKRELFALMRDAPFIEADSMLSDTESPALGVLRNYLERWVATHDMYSSRYLADWLGHTSDIKELGRYADDGGIGSDFAAERVRSLKALLDDAVDRGELVRECPTSDLAALIGSFLFGVTVWKSLLGDDADMPSWAAGQIDALMAAVEAFRPESVSA